MIKNETKNNLRKYKKVKRMKKYYYENTLANENITAKTNVVWVADIRYN